MLSAMGAHKWVLVSTTILLSAVVVVHSGEFVPFVAPSTLHQQASVSTSSPNGARVFHADESHQQNVAFHLNDVHEQQLLEDDLLTLFGLSRKPRLRRHKVAKQEAGPQYLLDLYRTLLDDSSGSIREDLTPDERHNLSSIIQGAKGALKSSIFEDFGHENNDITRQQNLLDIVDSDQIMTFTNQVRNRRNRFLNRRRDRKLWFNVHNIPMNSYRLVDAELRMYRDVFQSKINTTSPLFIRLYAMKIGEPARKLQFQLVDSIRIAADQGGWLRFNLSDIVQSWLHKPKSNLGLYLQVRNDNFNRDLYPKKVGIITQGRMNSQYLRQPFLTVYLKQTAPPKMRRPKRFYERASALFDEDFGDSVLSGNDTRGKRSARGQFGGRKRSSNISASYGFEVDEFNSFYSDKRNVCQKRQIFVSFRDLNWSDWIIAPEGYMAFFCDGECSFPLNDLNPTNHAILQGLLHQWNKWSVPKPCCTPRELSPIMVLYFDENSNAVLKKFKNMVVKKCGCL